MIWNVIHFICANPSYLMAGSSILLCVALWEYGND